MGASQKAEETQEESSKEREKSNFKYFWKFAADNETFLVPHDHEYFENAVIDKQLLFDIINGRQNKVLDFDYSKKEAEYDELRIMLEERYKEIAERYGDRIVTEEDQKRRDYMYFEPNREFSGKMESLKLKKVDDGTFIDNGYR